jgi:Divergent InlB B-repeat domain
VRRPPAPNAPGGAGRQASPFGHSAAAPTPEVVSTDPTILISHASRTPDADSIEPTIMVQREPVRRTTAPDPFAAGRTPARNIAPTPAEPTVIRRPSDSPPARPRTAASGGFVQRWKDLFGASGAAPARPATPKRSPAGAGGFSPGIRGAALVIGAVAVSALLLFAVVAAARWFWPAGQALTVTRPTSGTIVGPGIECGTKGNNCSTTRPTGDAVELLAQPDPGFVYSGFTGDCAPVGRVMMNQPHRCGATFDAAGAISTEKGARFPLTITKPVGGTIIGEPNILCGTLDNTCSADIATGTVVTMRFQADQNFAFQSFTGDCAASPELTMTAPKSCGAIFMPTPGQVINHTPDTGDTIRPGTRVKPVVREGDNGRTKQDAGAPTAVGPPPPPPPPPQPQGLGTGATTTTQGPPPPGPALVEKSPEQHAQEEIDDLVKRFCAAHQTLKVDGIKGMFPLAPEETYRYQFRQYKTLKCSITSKLEYVRLDARPAGAAQVKFEMKQVIQMKIGGQPQVKETIVTMRLSRKDFQTPWIIDGLAAEEKPK